MSNNIAFILTCALATAGLFFVGNEASDAAGFQVAFSLDEKKSPAGTNLQCRPASGL